MNDINKAINYIQNMDLSIFENKQEASEAVDLITNILNEKLNNGWIPVSSGRLPEIGDTILCITKYNYNEIFVGKFRESDKWKSEPYFDWKQNGFPEVSAWQPLPEKYIVK